MPSCEKIDTSRRGLIAKNIFLRAFFKSQFFGQTRNFNEKNSLWDFVMATSLTFFCTPGHNDKTFVIALRHESGWA